MDDKTIFRLNDKISFRKCSLFDSENPSFGDCTNFDSTERNWKTYYFCNQDGIHFHCTTHPEIELETERINYDTTVLTCPKCRNKIEIDSRNDLEKKCLRLLNIPDFKNAKLVRLDDW